VKIWWKKARFGRPSKTLLCNTLLSDALFTRFTKTTDSCVFTKISWNQENLVPVIFTSQIWGVSHIREESNIFRYSEIQKNTNRKIHMFFPILSDISKRSRNLLPKSFLLNSKYNLSFTHYFQCYNRQIFSQYKALRSKGVILKRTSSWSMSANLSRTFMCCGVQE